MASNKVTTNVTPEVIKAWKTEHGAIYSFKTTDNKIAYFREPDLVTLDAAGSMAATNPLRSNEVIAKYCFLGGDEEIITEKKYLLGLYDHLKKLINKVEGEFSEL